MNEEFFKLLPIDSANDPISMGVIGGYNLAAPASFWAAPEELRDAVAGGCGPGGVGDVFVPDSILWLDMYWACKIHDWCFAVWNDRPGFSLGNQIFKNNMSRINIQAKGWKSMQRARVIPIAFCYFMVQFLGEPDYYDSHLQYLV